MDFAQARMAMVDSQVRTNDVTDPALVGAFRAIPRENFVAEAARAAAYADFEPEAAPGRRLLSPRDLAKLLQALGLQKGEKALELAGATGYGAAIVAHCVQSVVTLDPSPELSFAARAALDKSGLANVTAVCTEAKAGWLDGAPYDVVFLNGAAEVVPDAWLAQLAEGGRLGVIVRDGVAGEARIYLKSGGKFAYRVAFDAAPPVAPGLRRIKTFAF
ncbi:MAG TPA: protein-L-isoaspartate O-methyltransferase [Caulobacterales bacterium]|jgi:protein-L-isoaspartate(D-aspartate) O-methyltransferase|nr:protein-L-isoaspartate O-methyltransferase [Caulobacterales bacterium]